MALADLEVVRVVGRRDLDGPRTELGVDRIVGDDRHPAVGEEGMHESLPDQVLVALVVWMDGYAAVAQHRLHAGRGDGDLARAVGQRIPEGDELAGHVLVLDLDVGECGRVERAPVDDPVPPIDEAVVEPPNEDGPDRAR